MRYKYTNLTDNRKNYQIGYDKKREFCTQVTRGKRETQRSKSRIK